jgi:methylase of polypeptide subunit release factors
VLTRLVACAPTWLRAGGWLVTELGGDQAIAIVDALAHEGFGQIAQLRDGDEDLCGVAAQLEASVMKP